MCFLLVKSDISDYSDKVESYFNPDAKKRMEHQRWCITEVVKTLKDLTLQSREAGKVRLIMICPDFIFRKIGDMSEWSEETFPTKMNMGTHIDELLQVSKHDGNEDAGDRSNKRFKPDSFDYRTAFFRDFNGDYYRVNISVGVFEDGKVAYSIGKDIAKRSFPGPDGSSSESQRRSNTKKASTDIVPYSEEYVNTYSTQNSEKDANEKSEMQLALEKAGIDSSIFKDTVNDVQNSIENLTPEQVKKVKQAGKH